MGGTLTQLGRNGHDWVIVFFSKNLSSGEQDYTENGRELLGLILFSEIFRCYLYESTFDILTDNQVLSHFITNQKVCTRSKVAGDLGKFWNLSGYNKTPKNTCTWICLSRAPNIDEIRKKCLIKYNESDGPEVNVEKIRRKYEDYQLLGPIVKEMDGEEASNTN